MKACLFAGPSLPVADIPAGFDGIRLPPVKQGDVFAAVRRHNPNAIGIVDGYFDQVPAVCHKEILWAMERGVRVYGAASMGALRAAELAPFGMIGVGRIYEAYRHGALSPYDETFEDDDEVAVLHGPAELGYVGVSEAMVNVRITLAIACEAGVIDAEMRSALATIGKRLFYADRSYPNILAIAKKTADLDDRQLRRLYAWLPTARVDQKRADAAALAAMLTVSREPLVVNYRVSHTESWAKVMAGVGRG